MAGESEAHGIISTNLTLSLGAQLRGGNCRAFSKDMKVRSGPAPSSQRSRSGLYSYPDLVVVCGERQYHDEYQDVLLNPTLIVEVLSDSTRNFDRSEKFLRYRAWLPTLTDYLLVEQNRILIEHCQRQSENVWQVTIFEQLDQTVFISSINCTLSLAEIYEGVIFPTPATEEVAESAGSPATGN
jgi:Uma2 family endonuclease